MMGWQAQALKRRQLIQQEIVEHILHLASWKAALPSSLVGDHGHTLRKPARADALLDVLCLGCNRRHHDGAGVATCAVRVKQAQADGKRSMFPWLLVSMPPSFTGQSPPSIPPATQSPTQRVTQHHGEQRVAVRHVRAALLQRNDDLCTRQGAEIVCQKAE